MAVNQEAKVTLAKWLKQVYILREASYDFENDRYAKSWWECIGEAGVEDDMKDIVFVLALWPNDNEEFVKKYAE